MSTLNTPNGVKRLPEEIERSNLNRFSDDVLLHELHSRDNKQVATHNGLSKDRIAQLVNTDTSLIAEFLVLRQKSLYGVDNRIEVMDIPQLEQRNHAEAVAALFEADKIADNGDGTSTLETTEYGKTYNLCAGQKFLTQPIGAFCTGFLVAPDLMATAGHCIKDVSDTDQIRFVFNYRLHDDGKPVTVVKNADIYRVASVVGKKEENNGADWALVRIDRPATNYQHLRVRQS